MRGRGALAYFLAFTDADANLNARNLVSRSPTGDRLLHRPSDVHLTLESAASAWIMLMPSPTIHVRPASIDTFRIVFLPLPCRSFTGIEGIVSFSATPVLYYRILMRRWNREDFKISFVECSWHNFIGIWYRGRKWGLNRIRAHSCCWISKRIPVRNKTCCEKNLNTEKYGLSPFKYQFVK